eukprot:maker-scaffold_9-snap-gene-1.36-mRNA-1 protein AED:0.19 eAED:0.21 QI:0/0/0/1/1/1/2/0/591
MRIFTIYFFVLFSLSSAIRKSINFINDLGGIIDNFTEEAASVNTNILNTFFQQNKKGYALTFPEGQTYLAGGILATSLENVEINILGTLLFTKDIASWPLYPGSTAVRECIEITNSRNIIIHGSYRYYKTKELKRTGIINGNGMYWWNYPVFGYLKHLENRPRILRVINSEDIKFHNLLLINSPFWTTLFENVTNVETFEVEIINKRTNNLGDHGLFDLSAFNTDGLDFTGRNVHVHDCTIYTQDDIISVKDGSKNMLFERIYGSGLGIAIGSMANSHNRNISFRDLYIYKSVKAIYFKYRKIHDEEYNHHMCPCNYERFNEGLVDDVTFENIFIDSPMQYGIWIGPAQQVDFRDPSTCSLSWPFIPGSKCAAEPRGKYSNIKLKNVVIYRPTGVGVFIGSEANPIENISLTDVFVAYGCENEGEYKKNSAFMVHLSEEELSKIFSFDRMLAEDPFLSSEPQSVLIGVGVIFVSVLVKKSTCGFCSVRFVGFLFCLLLSLTGYIVYVHHNTRSQLLVPGEYNFCEGVKSGTVYGHTWPVPECFETPDNLVEYDIDLECLSEFDFFRSFIEYEWLKSVPTYILLAGVHHFVG